VHSAILKHVEPLSGGQFVLSGSTCYSALVRLQEQGLIQRMNTDDEAGANPGLPRKAYVLTERGRRALETEMARLRRQVRVGQRSIGGEFDR
jgi:DNA-binding PadR family transcriptional regulator